MISSKMRGIQNICKNVGWQNKRGNNNKLEHGSLMGEVTRGQIKMCYIYIEQC
jgi:hypothetical protein